jgi:predicted metal-binding membrane protein
VTWIRDQITKFLRGVGLPGLSGLGGPEVVVPVAIVAVVLVAWAGVAYIHERNNAQDKGVAMLAKGMDSLVRQGATPEQIIEYAKAAEAETRALEPKNADPLGLASIIDALKPVLIAIAAIVIVPKVLDLIPRRRAAA